MEVMEVFIEELIPEEDLLHYGTPKHSGRYPWGSGENPYHHGRSNPFGRLKAKRDKKKQAKKRKEEKVRKAMEKPVETAEQREERKRKALQTGTATDIAPFIKEMSTKELRDARERLEEQEKFMRLVIKESPEGQRAAKIDKYVNGVQKVTQYANTGIGAYNAAARIHNGLSSGKEWPIIPEKGKTKKEIKAQNKKNKNQSKKDQSDKEVIESLTRVINQKDEAIRMIKQEQKDREAQNQHSKKKKN